MVSENLNFKCMLILGATASGKTALAHKIADELAQQNKTCELVNLDAFQIYKELNIGTAKPTQEEILKYNYHGIDICSLHENIDANTFAKFCWESCAKITEKKSIPICVGGSGLYLRAFLHGLDALPARNEKIRGQIKEVAQRDGWPACHAWLAKLDAKRASELHPNDKTRIERALEIYLTTGIPQSETRSKETILKEQKTLFPCFVIHSKKETAELKERIRHRVGILFEQGWQEEVNSLFLKYGDSLQHFHAMQAIGYKQILSSLETKIKKEELIEKISTLTWQYAKKQLTWCVKEKTDFVLEKTNQHKCNELIQKIFQFLLQK